VGCHQVALDAVDQELDGLGVGLLFLERKAAGKPGAEPLAHDSGGFHEY
jgi:hypothetical protein